ncbi:MAG: hypothetical protein J6A94_03960 [Lachnospiraceae bacterium]|nr:hypothetical protein [Lachnospiraceae bacterium]
MTENRMRVKPYPLGAHLEEDGIRFAFVSAKEKCGIILYDKKTGKKMKKIPFTKEDKKGKIYFKYVTGIKPEEVSYLFYEDEEPVADPYAKAFVSAMSYGKERKETDLKASFVTYDFDWEGDENPKIPYKDCIAYCMHVRGFTKHPTSNVTHKGTFLGLTEKISYLKEIGITTVELQPAYEFLEIPGKRELQKEHRKLVGISGMDGEEKKLNYWGYKRGFYYTPKAGYAFGEDPQKEFKQMVKDFHKNGMEVIMQFYFPKDMTLAEIPEILRFWVLEYHVDGFHLMGERIPMDLILQDGMLCDSKIWYYQFNTDEIYERNEMPQYCNLAEYQDDYLYTMRKFLKGDSDMLGGVMYQMRHIPEKCGRIHYMSNYYGMTLRDMVSYDYKHNEENGEEGRDGNDYNCSWNCGEEGNTRKKKIAALRIRQLKNAICMLMLSQSTPLIFMGDEFGNSQQGNNNPYCQDNKITWLDWRDMEKNKEIFEFWKALVALRKKHSILHPASEFRIMDYASCGYPDLSYHGENAWRPRMEGHVRHIGMMYCGKYALDADRTEDDFFYVAMNMHWEHHRLALPNLPKGLEWQLICSTETVEEKIVEEELGEPEDGKLIPMIPPRTIMIYKSEVK